MLYAIICLGGGSVFLPKIGLKGIITSVVILSIFVVIVVLFFFAFYHPITPVTTDKMWNVLIEQGYEPHDTTESYKKQDSNLIKAISVQKGDLRFDFFYFDNDKGASNVVRHAWSQIIEKYNTYPRVEGEWGNSNHYKYSLKASGVYSVTMSVSSTAIYAYCDAKNQAKIDAIFRAIGYVGH